MLQFTHFFLAFCHFLMIRSLERFLKLLETIRPLQISIKRRNILSILRCVKIRSDPVFLCSHLKFLPQLLVLLRQDFHLPPQFLHLLTTPTNITSPTFLILIQQQMIIPLQRPISLPNFLNLILIINRNLIDLILQIINPNLQIVILIPQLEIVRLIRIQQRIVVEIHTALRLQHRLFGLRDVAHRLYINYQGLDYNRNASMIIF